MLPGNTVQKFFFSGILYWGRSVLASSFHRTYVAHLMILGMSGFDFEPRELRQKEL
jgi:hypothetical protein